MNKLVMAALLTAQMLASPLSLADEAQTMPLLPDAPMTKEIPTTEKEFVKAINNYTKEEIIAQLGEPARAEDVKLKDSGKVVASIWYYHNINTAPDGSYFPTTELDFIDGKVVQVVYLNNDGSEPQEIDKTYDVPSAEPAL
ncbi:MAG: hypothetical protein K2V71_09190 [Methylotenera sp.]|nr:hypothetical protein [Methylotenera sp.]